MRTLKTKINNFIKDNGLKCYQSNDKGNYYSILMPYRNENNIRKTIFINVYNDLNLLKIGFYAQVNQDNSEKVMEKILDKDNRLVLGKLSLDEEQNVITFSIDWIVNESEEISKKFYDRYISFSLNVYQDLLEEGLVWSKEES